MIEVKGLSYRYKKARDSTLNDVNFHVKKGEIFGFLGPSGAGKSTTQKIMIGLLSDYQGTVKINGQEMKQKSKDFYEQIGVAFEFPNFYHKLTGLENINLFKGLYKRKTTDAMSLLKQVDLEDAASLRFHKYSKGMKMRLNFCRALLNDPEILFLDEPTSGLDPNNSRRLKDIMLQKKDEGKTIILTTHHMHLAEELCDRVAFMVDGKIALIDTPDKLKRENTSKQVIVEYMEGQIIKIAIFDLHSLASNVHFQQLLRSKEILSIHTKERTLEEVFLEVTGRSLR
ncbi:ABC transporter ATP-binding protein [Sutcliffiella horikoshii]|uniref:ABC transporter ATP-binding protein n=1 Tax=Sutcliffiella horikoshii TaxID=79883 RepID=UPI0038517D8A